MAALTEAYTCRKYVLPKLYAAGWDDDQITEQKTFTDGRMVVVGGATRRRKQKRAEYLLRYRPDFAIAVVEAKPIYQQPGDGLQQAKEYADILGLKFAFATNGEGIVRRLADLQTKVNSPKKLQDETSKQLGPLMPPPSPARLLLQPRGKGSRMVPSR